MTAKTTDAVFFISDLHFLHDIRLFCASIVQKFTGRINRTELPGENADPAFGNDEKNRPPQRAAFYEQGTGFYFSSIHDGKSEK